MNYEMKGSVNVLRFEPIAIDRRQCKLLLRVHPPTAVATGYYITICGLILHILDSILII